ncbi:MAG: replicative DNA helicase [Candidatus Bipolaricaulaceae bacterium]
MADVLDEGIRPIPKNKEAEQVVLGSALLEPEEAVPKLVMRLRPGHFYFRAHREIYRAMVELFNHGHLPDAVTVANYLEERGKLEEAGGRSYLSDLLARVTTVTALDHYTEIVETKALRRLLIQAGGQVAELGYCEDMDVEEALDRAGEFIFEIAQRQSTPDYHKLSEFLYDHLDFLEALHKDPERRPAQVVFTGFEEFDAYTSGLHPADLAVIAGRPGTGKTSFALAVARDVAIRQGKSVGFFSLEMTKEQVLERLLCAEAQVNLHSLRSGYLPPAKWGQIAEAAGRIHQATVLVDDTPGASVLSIKAKARRMALEHGLNLLVVDYLQLIEAGVRTDVREQEISYISRTLKGMARELNIPVIACSQLNRAVERREGGRPRLSDLRESGAIEQDADLVAFIHRPDYYEDATRSGPTAEAEVIIAKQRNGPTGKLRLLFHKDYATFYPPARQAEEVPF